MSAQLTTMEGLLGDNGVGDALDGARAADLAEVLVIGYTEDGNLWTHTNLTDGAEILWLLERCRHLLMKATDREERG